MKKSASEGSLTRVLVVEDDELFGQAMIDYLSLRYAVNSAEDAESAMIFLTGELPDIVLLDITLPDVDGVSLLRRIKSRWPDLPVIMLTAMDRIQTVVECMKLGAADYLTKPIISEELLASIDRALESVQMKQELNQRRELQLATNREYRLIGSSQEIERVKKEIQVVGKSDSPVLITGETGTGKELAAREIHACSARASGPFVALNCGAIPKDLFESEFFGHKKGAYTGAHTGEIGKFRLANHGTLLLDEVGELPPSAQIKLLRVLEDPEFYPVGSTELVRVNVRVIASTNRSLENLFADGVFRQDLYFRLNVYNIRMPALRERPGDILLLAHHFMQVFNSKFGKSFRKISPAAQDLLLSHSWKGNVRELRNVLERVVLSHDGRSIEMEHLGGLIASYDPESGDSLIRIPDEGIKLEEVEKRLIEQALKKAGGNRTRAAKLLGITPPTLYYRIEKYGLE